MKQIQGRHSFDWLQGERHWLGMIDGALSLTDFKRLHDSAFWTECLSELKTLNEMWELTIYRLHVCYKQVLNRRCWTMQK